MMLYDITGKTGKEKKKLQHFNYERSKGDNLHHILTLELEKFEKLRFCDCDLCQNSLDLNWKNCQEKAQDVWNHYLKLTEQDPNGSKFYDGILDEISKTLDIYNKLYEDVKGCVIS